MENIDVTWFKILSNVPSGVGFIALMMIKFRPELHGIGSAFAGAIHGLPAWLRDWIKTWEKYQEAKRKWKK